MKADDSALLRDFLDSWQDSAGIALNLSRAQSELLYRSFCSHMLDRLLNHEAPIPLIFATLHHCPYHHNWKGACHRREHKVKLTGKHDDEINFRLASPHFLGVRRNPYCYIVPHIELEHLPPWYEAADRVESTRRQTLGPAAYAKLTITRVLSRIPLFTRLYHAWVAACRAFAPATVRDTPGGAFLIHPRGAVAHRTYDDRRILHHLAPAIFKIVPTRNGRFTKPPPRRLRRLSAVQPPPAELRDARPLPP